jgi:hypothetical protein
VTHQIIVEGVELLRPVEGQCRDLVAAGIFDQARCARFRHLLPLPALLLDPTIVLGVRSPVSPRPSAPQKTTRPAARRGARWAVGYLPVAEVPPLGAGAARWLGGGVMPGFDLGGIAVPPIVFWADPGGIVVPIVPSRLSRV